MNKKIKVISLIGIISVMSTGCSPELYNSYEDHSDSPVSLDTDDNRWFGLNQGIRIVTEGDDVLLDYEIKENKDGTTTVILHIGEK